MKHRQQLKVNKMKNRILLTLGATIMTVAAINLNAGSVLLSPRAAGNQIKVVASATETTAPAVAIASASQAVLSPRAQGNQIKTVAGTETAAARCLLNGNPKYLAMAGNSARMSCCNLKLSECPTMAAMSQSN
jgi:hypothetical protein